jgi:hypothetical protein
MNKKLIITIILILIIIISGIIFIPKWKDSVKNFV